MAARGTLTGRALVLAGVSVLLVVTLAVPARTWFAQRSDIARLQGEVDAASARIAELAVQRERWQDPAFITAQARTRLHMAMPGEVPYLLVGAEEFADGPTNPTRVSAGVLGDAPATWLDRFLAGWRTADGSIPDALPD